MLLDDDSRALRESAQRLFEGSNSIRLLRQRRDLQDLDGAARGCWPGMVALGFAGILAPEEFGGVGLSSRASIHVSEMMGRTLAVGPFLSSAIMAVTAIREGNNPALKARLLPLIAEGAVVALAAEESPRHDPFAIETVARPDGDGFRVSGRKIMVVDGAIAETCVVVARHADDSDRMLMLVVEGREGVSVAARMGFDGHPRVDIAFSDAPANVLLCDPPMARALLDRVYDVGRLHLAAEMLGAAQEAFDRTLDYLKTREQFGRKIGEFQALQHRSALMFGELEIARSSLLKAAVTETALDISIAKARIGDIANHVGSEAVQLHGGIGVTDDFDLGLFLKRIRASSEMFGDSAFHIERYARLRGL